MPEQDDNFWEEVILPIEEGRVVPIVGRDLSMVQTDTGLRPYHNVVAERLAQTLAVPTTGLPPEYDVNDVICAYDGFRGDPTAINITVVRILNALKPKIPIPEPLRMLAEIGGFRLFVSTTFDTLLEDAVTAVRGRPPAVAAFPPASSQTDFDPLLLEKNGSFVFQILGRASASTDFGMTEGQVLEQMHDFMVSAGRPTKLLQYMQENHLLVLGVSFPDWLARFLLRLSRANPLWDSRATTEVIAERTSTQGDLSLFLKHFSPRQSRLYTGGSPVDFVRELHRRWFEKHPTSEKAKDPEGGIAPAEMARGSVFISYGSEDRAAAFRMADDLTSKNVEVWVDRRLNPGNDFRSIIERYIRECSAFIAVLSQNTQKDDGRWFRREWSQACDQGKDFFGTNRNFLFPVVVDSTPIAELNEIRNNLFGKTAIKAERGAVPDELSRQLDDAQKQWRKQFRQ
jgi:hypothetical protein